MCLSAKRDSNAGVVKVSKLISWLLSSVDIRRIPADVTGMTLRLFLPARQEDQKDHSGALNLGTPDADGRADWL